MLSFCSVSYLKFGVVSMKKVIVSIGCVIGVLASGVSLAAPVSNSQQVAANALQGQIQQVQASVPKQIKAQAAATNKAIANLQVEMQKQISTLQAQIQQVQTNLSTQIQHLQQQVVTVSQMR